MSGFSVTAFDALAPVPDFSVLELAIVIVFARSPGISLAGVGVEIARWFKTDVSECDLAQPVGRLMRREWLTTDGKTLHATEEARAKAELAARGIVQLMFRDRYFFDVGKLLEVTIIKEDSPHAR
jgi:hypothetical protein